jgi:hypothetical protein
MGGRGVLVLMIAIDLYSPHGFVKDPSDAALLNLYKMTSK